MQLGCEIRILILNNNNNNMKSIEIEGIKWYPEVVKKMKVDEFVKAHLPIYPFNQMDKKESEDKPKATAKLKAIFKKIN